MKVDVTLQNLYFNKGLAKFCFRPQAYKTFEDLVQFALSQFSGTFDQRLNELEFALNEYYQEDFDSFEEDCYSLSIEEILENIGYSVE